MLDINQFLIEARAKIAAIKDSLVLEQVRVEYLGKKGILTSLLRNMASMPLEKRREFGQLVNGAKKELEELIVKKRIILEELSLEEELRLQGVDVTLPARHHFLGGAHLITTVTKSVTSFFEQLDFTVTRGPEVEDEFHNFSALNTPENHPARDMHDTFYFADGSLLRSHTSPVQIREMRQGKAPFRLIAPGRVYRRDSDLTHTPMFHQVEGLVVDQQTSFVHLKAVLIKFLEYFFERICPIRFRPSYFPFTEPSAEVDIQCVCCQGKGCRICKNTGWLEILGCGMVHPNVLKNCDLDPEQYVGYAFGMGVERLAMLKYGITDLRLFFENDLRFLRQFN